MNIDLSWNEWLQVYVSPDWQWIYDPYSGQVYQNSGSGYVPVVSTPIDGGSVGVGLPVGYPPTPPAPLPPQPAAQPAPVYVQPPAPGSRVPVTMTSAPVYAPAPAPRPAPVVAPVATSPRPSSGSGQGAPAPRVGVAPPRVVAGTGGAVRMKNEPDPKQGYWEFVGTPGYWQENDLKNVFGTSGLPITKVRWTDGKQWISKGLAIYSSSDPKYQGGYYLLYDNPDNEWWKAYKDTILAVQVKPVLPF